jgi:geranylgeranyl diphosphate synthase type I
MRAAVGDPGTAALQELSDQREQLLQFLQRHTREALAGLGNSGALLRASEHMFAAPGKLLRPMLLLEACKAAGGDPAVVLPAAAGTEYGHMASLIHDDIIDGDAERRGQTALHVKFDLGAAILAGDLLIFETFLSYIECAERGVPSDRVLASIHTLTRTCIQICRGQALEAGLVGDLSASARAYLQVIRLKTASFYRGACRIGALMAGAPDAVIDALERYGHNLGMAFQIVDDILPYDGAATDVGKPLSSDLRNARVTLPVIYGLQDGSARLRQEIVTLFRAPTIFPGAHKRLAAALRDSGATARAHEVAERYTARAQHHLSLVPESEARERLHQWAALTLARDH